MAMDSLSFDWFILALRIAFIGIIFFFLYRVSRESFRELVSLGHMAPSSAAPLLPRAESALEVIDPAESSLGAGTMLMLDHYTTIGRRPDNSLVLEDGFISATHAEMMFDAGDWWVIDLDSTNGTLIGGVPVRTRTRVENGDIVQFGRVRLRVHI